MEERQGQGQAPWAAVPARAKPCNADGGTLPLPCPWRQDTAGTTRFPGRLAGPDFASTCGTPGNDLPIGAPLFYCHKSTQDGPKILCAGWLAAVGQYHIGIRFGAAVGLIDGNALRPRPGWPPLFASHADLVAGQQFFDDVEEYRGKGGRPHG